MSLRNLPYAEARGPHERTTRDAAGAKGEKEAPKVTDGKISLSRAFPSIASHPREKGLLRRHKR